MIKSAPPSPEALATLRTSNARHAALYGIGPLATELRRRVERIERCLNLNDQPPLDRHGPLLLYGTTVETLIERVARLEQRLGLPPLDKH